MSAAAKKQAGLSPTGMYLTFTPPGPVAQGWLLSSAPTSLIIGPVGSAKTTTAGMKCMGETCRQHPSIKDGVRRALITAVRPNYRRMEDTVVASFKKFFGREADWTGTKEGPQEIFLRWHERGDAHELRIWLRAIGDQSVDSFVRGYEPSGWYVNEFDELPQGTLSKMASRCGRYLLDHQPDPEVVPPARYCRIFGDCNMPDFDSWVHTEYLNAPQPDVEIYLQPSGFSPEAENMQHLSKISPTYYQDMADNYRREGNLAAISRFIENKPGYSQSGKPIYPMFQSHVHTGAANMQPLANRRLIIGVDQGGQAAAAICQDTHEGAMRVYDEVVLEPGVYYGGAEFGRLLGARLKKAFPRFCHRGGLRIVMDPAARNRDSSTSEDNARGWAVNFIEGLELSLGLTELDWVYAVTNDLKRRQGAVVRLLTTRTMGGAEGFQVHPQCQRTLRGFVGGYRYSPIQGRPGEYKPKPAKPNPFTDIHDGIQYAALDIVDEMAREVAASGVAGADNIAATLSPWSQNSWDATSEQVF